MDELELLRAMFGEDELEIDEGARTVCCLLQPRVGEDAASRHVQAWLRVELPAEYPRIAPRVSLERARGLVSDEEADLLRAMVECAAAAEGESCLHALFEEGAEALTRLNSSGECPICRDDLFADGSGGSCGDGVGSCGDGGGAGGGSVGGGCGVFGGGDGAPGPSHVYLSPCGHSFHSPCIGAWWHTYEPPRAPALGGAVVG